MMSGNLLGYSMPDECKVVVGGSEAGEEEKGGCRSSTDTAGRGGGKVRGTGVFIELARTGGARSLGGLT